MYECIRAGRIHQVSESPTISNSTAGGVESGSVTFPICQKVIGTSVLVSEDEIRSAMTFMETQEGEIVEGAAAVSVASLLQQPERYRGKLSVVVLCGGNR
jgi:threonine dehydratase